MTARGVCALNGSDTTYLQHEIQRQTGHYAIMTLASQKASPSLRAIGEEGAAQSASALTKLKALAHSNGVEVPTKSDLRQRNHYGTLYALKGSAFDSAFLNDALIDDRIALDAQRQQVTSGHNPALKSYATSHARVLQNEISKLEKIQH
jgi:hypothetical protein